MYMNASLQLHREEIIEVRLRTGESYPNNLTIGASFGPNINITLNDEQLSQVAEAIRVHLEQKNPEYPDQQRALNYEIESEIERRVTA